MEIQHTNSNELRAEHGKPGTVFEMAYPRLVTTGRAGEVKLLQIAADRAEIANWADRTYDDARFFSATAVFGSDEYPPKYFPIPIFIFIATEHNHHEKSEDAYIYAFDQSKSSAPKGWRLVALGLRVISAGGSTECAYFDSDKSVVTFGDRIGGPVARIKLSKAARFLKRLSHV